MDYRNPKYEQRIIKKMKDLQCIYEICTLLSSFGQKIYGQKVLYVWPFRFFVPFFSRFLYNDFFWSYEIYTFFIGYDRTKTNFFTKRFYTQKGRKNQSCLRTEYRKLSWAIKYFFAFLQKVNNSIATKLCEILISTFTIFLKQYFPWHNSMN